MSKKHIILTLLFFSIINITNCSFKEKNSIEIYEENGLTIISNPEQPLYPNAEFIWQEELSIGVSESDTNYMFYKITGIDVDDQGNIYVLNSGNNRVQVFDKKGKFLYNFGNHGQGPGEFMRAMKLRIGPSKTIYIADLFNRRISSFRDNGDFIDGFNVQEGLPLNFYIDGYENLYVAKDLLGGEPGERYMNISKYSNSGTLVHNYGDFFEIKIQIIQTKQGMIGGGTGYNPKGSWIIDGLGNMYYGISTAYEITVYSNTGDIIRKIVKKWEPPPLSRQEKNKVLEQLNDVPSSVKDKIKFQERIPAFEDFIVDEKNQLWVELILATKKVGHLFDVFDKDGKYLYQVNLPFIPYVFKKGEIYTKEKIEDDIEVVKKYSYSLDCR
jgi:DNA-binding beta-propeller fold protein YncE